MPDFEPILRQLEIYMAVKRGQDPKPIIERFALQDQTRLRYVLYLMTAVVLAGGIAFLLFS